VVLFLSVAFPQTLWAGWPDTAASDEAIAVVRVEDDLMVRWLCPGFQKTSLLVLNGEGQWEATDSTYTPDVETQYFSIPRVSRKGLFITSSEELQEFPRLRTMMPACAISGLPSAIRIDILRPDGSVDLEVWDGQVALSTTSGVSLSPQTLPVHNGVASGLLTVQGEGEAVIAATFQDSTAEKVISSLGSSSAQVVVSGQLTKPLTVWKPADGIVHVTGDVTVPAGLMLRIYPDTIILLDAKKSIFVYGSVECLGTVEHPVLFAAANPDAPWGEISHSNTTAKSIYRGTFFIRGGDSPGAGHTTKGPVVRVSHAEIEFDYSNFMDNYGKGLYSTNGNLRFTHCLFSRSEMGMEVVDTDVAIDRCFFIEMPMGGDIADNDPLYLHGQGNMSVTNTVFAIGGDDGIDTLSSTPVIENCIIHGFLDKGISVFYGAPHIKNCLIFDNDYGISAKGDGTDVYVDRVTIVRNRVSVQSRNKYNDPNAVIKYYVTNCILWDHDRAVQTDYPIEDISITFCDLQGDPLFPGEGNINDDPLFVAPDENNYRLQDASPCRAAGQNGVDMGYAFPESP
jgi:hypothetical protein